ncbi:MAG: EamA family transporter [Synergistaceae bacterium]|nr:EamA family transporter [Synergistaceae bacterium]
MIQLFTAGILWGTIGIFVKTLSSMGADGSTISFLRMFSALAVTSVLAFCKHGRKIILHDKYTIAVCLLLGLVSNGIFNILYSYSISTNGMGVASVLMYTAPVFTAIASALMFGEKFSAVKISALAMNILGCVLTVTGGNFSGSAVNFWGLLAGLGTGFCYGMAAVIGRLAGEKTDALITSVYSYLAASVFLIVFMKPDISSALNSPGILGVGFLYGLIPTSLAYLVYYNALKMIDDTSKVPVIASIEPVAAVMIGMTFYGEKIGIVNLIGIAVVLISIIIMAKSKSK